MSALPGGNHSAKAGGGENELSGLRGAFGIPGLRLGTENSLSALPDRNNVNDADMSSRLQHIKNWHELAQQAKWTVSALAQICRVSERTLRSHFLAKMGRSPKVWLAEQRQSEALALLDHGASIKEVAATLGYNQQTNFTRKFKRKWGICPSELNK